MVDLVATECTFSNTSADIEHTPRAVGAGLPAPFDTSTVSPLPQPSTTDGGSSITFNDANTQTVITVRPEHNFITFSAKTCAELLPSLSDEQLAYEIRFNDLMGRNLSYVIDEDLDVNFNKTSNTSKGSKIDALGRTINSCIAEEFSEIFYDCDNYACVTQELSRAIGEAKKFIDEIRQSNEAEPEDAADVFYDCVSSESQLPTPVCFLDFNVGEGIVTDDFVNTMDFKTIGKRKVAHFGPEEYRYSGVVHPTCEYPDNAALNTIRSRLEAELPAEIGFRKDEWCCLVTLYESGKSYIPPHSDHEDSIVSGSSILTVSIGETRTIEFQNILGPLVGKQKFDLVHGSIHKMTQSSQKYWEHSIPPSSSPNCGPRLSLTFRKLQKTESTNIPPISQPPKQAPLNPPPPQASPKRLLLLSDSIHLTFPVHLFDQKSVICIKKRLPNFCLSDIHKFENEFKYTDYVFISCGINDLSRYGSNALNLYMYFKNLMYTYQTRYPGTIFIFNSLLTTTFGK